MFVEKKLFLPKKDFCDQYEENTVRGFAWVFILVLKPYPEANTTGMSAVKLTWVDGNGSVNVLSHWGHAWGVITASSPMCRFKKYTLYRKKTQTLHRLINIRYMYN